MRKLIQIETDPNVASRAILWGLADDGSVWLLAYNDDTGRTKWELYSQALPETGK